MKISHVTLGCGFVYFCGFFPKCHEIKCPLHFIFKLCGVFRVTFNIEFSLKKEVSRLK